MRVLVVEDDATLAEFVARGLREAGWAVDRAGDGQEGLELWERERYDAAVVDVMLPRRDGISLVEEARRRGIGRMTLATWAFNQQAHRFFEAQGFEYYNHRMWLRLDNA